MLKLFLIIAITMDIVLGSVLYSTKTKIAQQLSDEERFYQRRKQIREEDWNRCMEFYQIFPGKTYAAFVKAVETIDKIMEEERPGYIYWNFKNDFLNPNYVHKEYVEIEYRVEGYMIEDVVCFKDMKVCRIKGIGEVDTDGNLVKEQEKQENVYEETSPETKKETNQQKDCSDTDKSTQQEDSESAISEEEEWIRKNYAFIEKETKNFTVKGIIPTDMIPQERDVVDKIVDRIYLTMPIDSVEFGSNGEIILIPQN